MPRPMFRVRFPRVRLIAASAVVCTLPTILGCSEWDDSSSTELSGHPTSRDGAAGGDAGGAPGSATADAVEDAYLLGPAAARQLGYRVDWEAESPGNTIRLVAIEDDAVFTLDTRNFLTRLRRDAGDRVWRIPVANPLDVIFGITYVSEIERIYLMTGSDLLVLDSASGSRISKQHLDQVANTAAVKVNHFLVYGSRSGRLVWHSYRLETPWRAYQVGQSILVPPRYSDGHLIAVGMNGEVMNIMAGSASRVWATQTLAPIMAPPAVGGGTAFVASLDQHLRAYDLAMDRSPLWEYLTESALTDGPVLIDDSVYQQVPSEGLVCLEARPADSPGGVVQWRARETTGSVVTRLGDNLITWDPKGKQLTVVDSRLGATVTTMDLPQLDKVIATDVHGGELFMTGVDGRISRLVRRH